MNWIGTQTRPDASFDASDLSSVGDKAIVEDALRANKVLKKTVSEQLKLRYCKIYSASLSIECYTDASLGNLPDVGSQGGYVIFLSDLDCARCAITCQFLRLRWVVKSILRNGHSCTLRRSGG